MRGWISYICEEVCMADEQSGAEASPDPAKPAGPAAQTGDKPPAADLQDTAKADLEELKRKFREALERKRGTHASANAEGAQDTGKVHGSHGPAASRRSFRRKSGG
jgi:Family of unknown function (DUF5302)